MHAARAVLESDQYADAVRETESFYQAHGIHSVPSRLQRLRRAPEVPRMVSAGCTSRRFSSTKGSDSTQRLTSPWWRIPFPALLQHLRPLAPRERCPLRCPPTRPATRMGHAARSLRPLRLPAESRSRSFHITPPLRLTEVRTSRSRCGPAGRFDRRRRGSKGHAYPDSPHRSAPGTGSARPRIGARLASSQAPSFLGSQHFLLGYACGTAIHGVGGKHVKSRKEE